ncbi:MAG: hypothetical protein WC600_17280 [Desulfobaccales bacterium]
MAHLPHNPEVTMARIIEVLAGKISLADARAIHTILNEDVEARFQDLTAWLDVVALYLPSRSHSKITRLGLSRFVWKHRGWFRVRDFAYHLEVHDKTAWEYLKTLHGVGLVAHNGERSSRARYRIELPGAIDG